MEAPSFYWHDYETFGTHPAMDRPAQFAGLRTDENLTIIEPPLVVYCRLADDYLPNPEACVITGITPQQVNARGVCEADFIRLIHQQMARANTCSVGYNSIRFDDEITRNCLYRNFYDPYAREWQHGNSRWDLIDVVRATKALRPEGIQWPVITQEGQSQVTFKLDRLTVENGIEHSAAHDALADVYATIAIAELVKTAQPKLYEYCRQHRFKTEASKLLNLNEPTPIVHISGRYANSKNSLAIVVPLCKHPTNSNGVIVYDLSIDPEPLLHLSVEDIQNRLFVASADLAEGVARIPLKTVHLNKCPVLAPINVIKPADAQRLQLDLPTCYENLKKLTKAVELKEKIAEVFTQKFNPKNSDPDLAIYSGGFLSESDRQKLTHLRQLAPEKIANKKMDFEDARIPEMILRYRARNYPETLTQQETKDWQAFCLQRLTGQDGYLGLTFEQYFNQIHTLRLNPESDVGLLDELTAYGYQRKHQLQADA